MTTLHWFHALERNTPEELAEALLNGPKINPDPACRTQENEKILQIKNSVYAYLGKTSPKFGWAAFSIPTAGVSGDISPFDTGGLVAHIRPVSTWPEAEKRGFLANHTWPSSELGQLLTVYPGPSRDEMQSYLAGKVPSAADPGELLKGAASAEIWRSPNRWPAWTWELRTVDHLALPTGLHAWSCSSVEYRRFFDFAERKKDAQIDALLKKYVRGGVTGLVRRLRAVQLP